MQRSMIEHLRRRIATLVIARRGLGFLLFLFLLLLLLLLEGYLGDQFAIALLELEDPPLLVVSALLLQSEVGGRLLLSVREFLAPQRL